jgi:hypothetical protein
MFTLLRLVRKALKKQSGPQGPEELQALKGGMRRMKRETERSVYEHFRDYQENIKFQFMLRLVEATSSRLYEGLTHHFCVYVSDLNGVISSMGSERSDKKQVGEAFERIENSIKPLNARIDALRGDIRQMRGEDIGINSMPAVVSART